MIEQLQAFLQLTFDQIGEPRDILGGKSRRGEGCVSTSVANLLSSFFFFLLLQAGPVI
jgi:hypothetical protein